MQDSITRLIDFLRGTPVGRAIVVSALVNVAVALWMAWVLGSPLFLNTVVDEEFPVVTPAPDMTEQMPPAMVTPPDDTDNMASEPVLLSSGQFMDQDRAHRGSGDALIYQLADGSRVLRFEDFMVTSGPRLEVLLSPNPDPDNSGELGDYRSLGSLKGNEGNQNYDIPAPADLDLSEYQSVVIYCVPFRVVFSVATLSDS